MTANPAWQPTTFLSYIRTVKSSSRVAVIRTDTGEAYLKAINNPEGAQVLALDWFGTQLAQRFGLKTFEVSTLKLTEFDEIPLGENTIAQSGLAFITCAEDGNTMGGEKTLASIENLDDIPRVVVLDTWVKNCDRYAPGLGRNGQPRMNMDNLFLSTEGAAKGKFILKAIDFGHILTCGRPLSRNLAFIESVQEERLYGLFPFFCNYVTIENIRSIANELRGVRSSLWIDLLRAIPDDWDVSDEAKQAIDKLLLDRARFLADNIEEMLSRELQLESPPTDPNEGE